MSNYDLRSKLCRIINQSQVEELLELFLACWCFWRLIFLAKFDDRSRTPRLHQQIKNISRKIVPTARFIIAFNICSNFKQMRDLIWTSIYLIFSPNYIYLFLEHFTTKLSDTSPNLTTEFISVAKLLRTFYREIIWYIVKSDDRIIMPNTSSTNPKIFLAKYCKQREL